jgi:hypothetical protein
MCIRSVNCERKTYGQTCSPCFSIRHNSCFLNRVQATVPDPKNIKFTPTFYFNNNPLLMYLKNTNINQLNGLLGAENSTSVAFWTELAGKAACGVFEEKPVFKGLCYIMLQMAKREEQDKGLQNIKYTDEILNFFVILGSISPKALDLFRQNLAGMTIRTIR